MAEKHKEIKVISYLKWKVLKINPTMYSNFPICLVLWNRFCSDIICKISFQIGKPRYNSFHLQMDLKTNETYLYKRRIVLIRVFVIYMICL